MTLIDLDEATDPAASGGKAAPLARLARAGLPVPAGFVVPTAVYRRAVAHLAAAAHPPARLSRLVRDTRLPEDVVGESSLALRNLAERAGTPYVAVRSSSPGEDGEHDSAAGQHATVLVTRGTDEVCRAVVECWAALWDERAVAYRSRVGARGQDEGTGRGAPAMAVLVQALVDAEVAGVMFTGPTTIVEASWGLGESVASGRVSPDRWHVREQRVVASVTGRKTSRADRVGGRLLISAAPADQQRVPCLAETEVLALARLGHDVGQALGRDRLDVEWARAAGTTWVLQARPVTADVGGLTRPPAAVGPRTRRAGQLTCEARVLSGVPASPGTATGPARAVRGPADFASVRPGDVVVCRHTDPAWTPLFPIASAVVTEEGGLLSHAAIVAREVGIPAVLGVTGAVEHLAAATVTVDGDRGTVSTVRTVST